MIKKYSMHYNGCFPDMVHHALEHLRVDEPGAWAIDFTVSPVILDDGATVETLHHLQINYV